MDGEFFYTESTSSRCCTATRLHLLRTCSADPKNKGKYQKKQGYHNFCHKDVPTGTTTTNCHLYHSSLDNQSHSNFMKFVQQFWNFLTEHTIIVTVASVSQMLLFKRRAVTNHYCGHCRGISRKLWGIDMYIVIRLHVSHFLAIELFFFF